MEKDDRDENFDAGFDPDDWEYSDGFDEAEVEASLGFDNGTYAMSLPELAKRFNRRLRLTEKEIAAICEQLRPKEKVLYLNKADADIDGNFCNITLVLTDSRFFYLTNQRRFYSCSTDSFSTIWCGYMYTKSVPLENVTSVEYESFGTVLGIHFLKIETGDNKCYELQMPGYLFSKNAGGDKELVMKIFCDAVRNCKADAARAGKKTTPDE